MQDPTAETHSFARPLVQEIRRLHLTAKREPMKQGVNAVEQQAGSAVATIVAVSTYGAIDAELSEMATS
jgi:hypothetical protein